MDLRNKNIAFFEAVKCEYGGNTFLMLMALARKLRDSFQANVFFVLPKQKISGWHEAIQKEFELIFTEAPYDKCSHEIEMFLKEKEIDLIHSHYEAYDISVAKAIIRSGRNIKQVWHLHDWVNLDLSGRSLSPLRKLYRNVLYWRKYNLLGGKAYLLGVSAEILYIIEQFKDSMLLRYPRIASNDELSCKSFKYGEILLNGIDISRLSVSYVRPKGVFTFFTFGGRTYGKGIPVILDACDALCKERIAFRMMITKGTDTLTYVKKRYGEQIPLWLELKTQSDDIASLFSLAHCYISASQGETMSMAIAEASIYGLPVIQNDIAGSWWNADTPSAFVFRKDNVTELVSLMKKVMDMNPEELAEKCKQSSAINKERLALEHWVDRVVDVYLRI